MRASTIGLAALAALTALAGAPRFSSADDSKKDSLTLLPWTDASIVFTEKDKRARVQYTQVSTAGISTTFEASAPLDEDTRLAAFTAENHLVSGWKGSFQVGWDQRADRLGVLQARLEKFAEAITVLKSLRGIPVKAKARFAIAHKVAGNDREILLQMCERLKVTEGACAKASPAGAGDAAAGEATPSMDPDMKPLEDAICAQEMGGACSAVSFLETAGVFLERNCSKEDDTSDRCFTVEWAASRRELTEASQTAIAQHRLVEEMWSLLEKADPEQAKKLKEKYLRPFDAVVADPDLFVDVVKGVMRKAALERRDILLTGQLIDTAWTTAFVLDATLSYDRAKVFQDDIASKAKDTASSDLELGANLSVTPGIQGLTLSGRIGVERKRESGAKPFERCTVPGSSDGSVTGKMCDPKALFRSGARPDAETGGYIRLAVDYQYHGAASVDDLTPGVELRLGFEGLGADSSAEVRLALFGTPVKGTSAARVGVAIAADCAIDPDDKTDRRWTFTPMAFVGATFSGLMASP